MHLARIRYNIFMLLCFMQSGIRTCWYCDIEKDQDERNHLFSVIVGCRTLSLKVASHANKQGLTNGSMEPMRFVTYSFIYVWMVRKIMKVVGIRVRRIELMANLYIHMFLISMMFHDWMVYHIKKTFHRLNHWSRRLLQLCKDPKRF